MKKILKITGIVIGVLLVLLLALPILFKGKIKDIVVREGNKMLNAQFDVRTVNISLIRDFPKATVTIRDFAIWGIDDFARDTLASIDRLSLTVNLGSIFSGDGFEVSRVTLDGATVKAIVLEDGRPNWDIMKPSDRIEESPGAESSNFEVKLRKLTLNNVNAVYDDRQGSMYASLDGLSATASGDLGADRTMLKIRAAVESLTFRYGDIPYISKAKLAVTGNVDADLENMRFTLNDNTIALNEIRARLEGMFGMTGDGYDIDLNLGTDKISFKDILSMIPAIYAKEFQSLQASGDVALTAWVKGKMSDDALPAFEVSLDVTDGRFRYPALPGSVDDIRISASAMNPGGNADLTTVSVRTLRFTMAGNPFSATLDLATPVSDLAFAVTAKGKIDLGAIREVYPLDGVELSGVLAADLDLKGRMSYIEKELYDRIQAAGTLHVADMTVKMENIPDVTIKRSLFTFTPKYLQLSETTVGIGRSDITADCRLENYIPFALRGETIGGNLNLRSNLLDLNELMTGDETPESEEPAVTAPVIPKNIDFVMAVNMQKVLFDNLELDNVRGNVAVRNGALVMDGLSFNTLQGSVMADGSYSTAEDPEHPYLAAGFKMQNLSFSESFEKFVTIRKLAPVFEGLKGNFSGNMQIKTQMDSLMNPDYATLNGGGNLQTKDVTLSGIGALDAIADAVKREDLKNIGARDLNIDFTIKNGRVATQPFDIRIGSDMNLNLSGSTGIDQTIDYTGKLKLPASAGVAASLTTVDLKIGGTFTSPSVSIDARGMVQQAVENAKEVVKDKVLDGIGKKLNIDISDAEKQRETLIDEATKAGAKLVEEARKQVDNLVKQAGDKPLAIVAAKAAGAKLVKEAQSQADALVAKATEQGNKLVEKAKQGEE